MCIHVLLGGEGGLVTRSGLGRVISAKVDEATSVKVHFDRFSHSSGHQRGYVRCLRHGPVEKGGHPCCFKYIQVRKRGSQRRAAGYLAAWAFETTRRPASWLKEHHNTFEPDEEFAMQLTAHIS